MIMGEEKFESLIRDWFKMLDQINQDRLEAFSSSSINKMNNSTNKPVIKRSNYVSRKNSTIFSLLQQVI